MKKIIAILLAIITVFSLTSIAFADNSSRSYGAYKHVYIIGIDGSGAAWEDCNTQNFDRIFGDNAYRYDAHTEYITVSAQNWGSILTGLDYETHGFTNDNTSVQRNKPDSGKNTIFYYTRQAMPDAVLVSFNDWSNINRGIIETDIGIKKINRKSDPLVIDAIDHYFDAGNEPTLMFVQLDSVDHAGHSYGNPSAQYTNAIEKADMYLGEIYDSIESNGMMEDALFILVADHGETTDGHGGFSKEESSAVVAVAGKTVNKTILDESVKNRDVAAIALYALGIKKPDCMSSVVPNGLFGASKEKTTAGNPMTAGERATKNFLYIFVRGVNCLVSMFDWLAK